MKEYLESFNRFICCDNTIESLTESLTKLKDNPLVQYDTPKRLLPANVAKEILV